MLTAILVLAVLAISGYTLWSFNGMPTPAALERSPAGGTAETTSTAANSPIEQDRIAGDDITIFARQIPITEITDTQYIKLVNRDHALHTPVSSAQLVPVWPDMPARDASVTLHETAFGAMGLFLGAARDAGFHTLFIASGHRTHEEQSGLYANAVDTAYVMPAGHSEHQLGLAADILKTGDEFQGMAGTDEARWMAENASRFGLVLRYPEDKQHITQVAYEPWHFRYVGRIHAWIMAQYNFVLEEYIDFLQQQGSYEGTLDGRTYFILYQQPENGMLFVPEDLAFNVSSANTGGYIVTAWR